MGCWIIVDNFLTHQPSAWRILSSNAILTNRQLFDRSVKNSTALRKSSLCHKNMDPQFNRRKKVKLELLDTEYIKVIITKNFCRHFQNFGLFFLPKTDKISALKPLKTYKLQRTCPKLTEKKQKDHYG